MKRYRLNLNLEKLTQHLRWSIFGYAMALIFGVGLWSAVWAMAFNVVKDEEKVDIYLVGEYVYEERLVNLKAELKEAFPEYKEINLIPMTYTGYASNDTYTQQQLYIYIGSGVGDIFIFKNSDFRYQLQDGLFISLDDYVNEEDYDEETLSVIKGVSELDETGEEHVYGLPLYDTEILSGSGFDVSDKVAGVTAYSNNQEGAIKVLQWIMEHYDEQFYFGEE